MLQVAETIVTFQKALPHFFMDTLPPIILLAGLQSSRTVKLTTLCARRVMNSNMQPCSQQHHGQQGQHCQDIYGSHPMLSVQRRLTLRE